MAGNLPWETKRDSVRTHLEDDCLEKIANMWLAIYMATVYMIDVDLLEEPIEYEWFWSNQDPVNRDAHARADAIEVAMGTKTLESCATARGASLMEVAVKNAESLTGGDMDMYWKWVRENLAKHSAQVPLQQGHQNFTGGSTEQDD